MSAYVLIPVFNRLAMTEKFLGCLRAQQVDESLYIYVIDDGSTDSTGVFLEGQDDVSVVKGDGSLWWGGAIEIALQTILQRAGKGDWVLFANNDTLFDSGFVQSLLTTARARARAQAPAPAPAAAVGSIVYDENNQDLVISIGALIDTRHFLVHDKLKIMSQRKFDSGDVHEVDALSSRGVLFPVAAFYKAGTMKPSWLPHYLADYELSIRVRKAGYQLLVSEDSVVLSAEESGHLYRVNSFWSKLFSVRSPAYLPAVFLFWWQVNSVIERLTLLPRLIYISLWRSLQRGRI